MDVLSNIGLALPEIFLVIVALVLLMVGAFSKRDPAGLVGWASVAAMAVAAVMVLGLDGDTATTFGGMFVVDSFAVFAKVLILVAAILTLILALSWLKIEGLAKFEFSVVVLLAVVGMMMMVSANDLMSLYLGLELQSLSLYVIAAYHRDNARSTEAGLKYFVLGALASGLLLYGASLIYGFAGTTDFAKLAQVLADGHTPIGVTFGVVFVLAGLAFKVAAVPFHMWTPDVYEGAPTPVTAFFAVAPKIAAVALLLRVMIGPFGPIVDQWQQVVWFIAVASMIIGAFAALGQNNIKRLMAYSSIGNIGYGLMGLVAGNEAGVRAVLIFFAIYVFMNVGTFAIILAMRVKGRAVETVQDLAGLAKNKPMMAVAMAAMMFSMAGIPPLAGFFGKFYVFLAAVNGGFYTLAVIGVLTSVVSAFYYLRVIKVMYFDEPAEALDPPGRVIGTVVTVSTVLVVLFFILPAPLMASAGHAAAALFAG